MGKKLGKRMKTWRHVSKGAVFKHLKENGITQGQLAKKLGISLSAVGFWRSGKSVPGEINQKKLATLVGKKRGRGRPAVRQSALPAGNGSVSPAFSAAGLVAYRQGKGISRAKLAKRLKVSMGSIQNWENGKSRPTGKNRQKLWDLLVGNGAAPPVGGSGGGSIGGSTPAAASTRRAPSDAVRQAAIQGAAQVVAAYVGAGGKRPRRAEVLDMVVEVRGALEG